MEENHSAPAWPMRCRVSSTDGTQYLSAKVASLSLRKSSTTLMPLLCGLGTAKIGLL